MSNLIKRTVPVFLVLALCFTFLISPAAASSFDPGYITGINVLDYVTADGDNSKATGADTYATFVYDLPYKSLYTYVDAVVATASGSISAAYGGTEGSAIDSSGKSTLTIKKFGNANRLHRIYGVIPTRNYQSFELKLKGSDADVSVNIISLKLSNSAVSMHDETGVLSVTSYKGNGYYTMKDANTAVTHSISAASGGYVQLGASADLYCTNWKNYDFIEFSLMATCSSIQSVSAQFGYESVPTYISFLDGPSSTDGCSDNVKRIFTVSLDLRNLNRTVSADPILTISFNHNEGQAASFSLLRVHGVINEDNIEPDLYFLRNIWDSLKSGFSNVVSAVNSAKTAIVKAIEGISIEVDSIDYTSLLLNIQGSLSGISTNLQSWLGDLIDTSSGNNLILGNLYKDLPTLIDSINSSIWSLDDQLVDQFESFTDQFIETNTDFKNDVGSKITTLSGNLKTWFQNLQAAVIDSISAFKLEFINQITSLKETLGHKLDNIRGEIQRFISVIDQWYVDFMGLFREVFGMDDTSAEDAQQTQEDVNVSINNQLVGAVENWNANIEVVETGYDLAVSKATPALVWIGSLADRIFDNMGWFGSIYFLIGLISVFMLILSKSGLARSIGAASRRN